LHEHQSGASGFSQINIGQTVSYFFVQDGTFQPKKGSQPDGQQASSRVDSRPDDLAVRGRYAIRPTAVTEIDALTKHTPAIGCHYIMLSMRGAVNPPLYFHNGGIKTMLTVLKQHVRLVKTVADPNTYVITADCGPLQPQLSLDCSDVRLGGPPRHSDTTLAPISKCAFTFVSCPPCHFHHCSSMPFSMM
jgi:hypothetical protein